MYEGYSDSMLMIYRTLWKNKSLGQIDPLSQIGSLELGLWRAFPTGRPFQLSCPRSPRPLQVHR